MQSETLVQLLQSSFRITLGATASLIEVLQDPEKREENLTKLRQEWSELSERWAEKGEFTEQEARNFVNDFLNRPNQPGSETASGATSTATPAAPPDVQIALQELTAQIAAVRAELENTRNSEPGS